MTQNVHTHPVVCGVCGSADAKPLFSAIDRLHGFEGTFYYVQCGNCGLVYMNPQIAFECLTAFYPAEYAPHQAAGETRNKRTSLRSLPEHILNAVNPEYMVLDVGCGSGEFLHRLRQSRRCRVFGVDVSENAVQCAGRQYGLEIVQGQILDVPFGDHTFDLITAWSCIEHLNDPAAVIQKMNDLCKPSGTVFIQTVNYDSFAAKWFRDKWYHLDCPRHLYLFSPKTITALLKKYDFENIHIFYETSSKGWRGSLQYFFCGDNYRPEVKNKIRHSSLVQMMVSPLSHISALLKKADTMMVTARKKDK